MISQVAGIDLVPAFDFEIANINISINDQPVATIQKEDGPLDDVSAVAWHYDSFPFVCVMMMSDCTGMVGGETAVRTPAGETLKIRGPGTVGLLIRDMSKQVLTDFIGYSYRPAGQIY